MSNVKQYALEIQSVILYKFGSLITGAPNTADLINSIDITPQVQEIDLFESIFSPVIRAEIGVIDPINLLVNFPLTGEEAVYISYRNIRDQKIYKHFMIIDRVSHMAHSDDARSIAYMLNCVAIESYGNARQTVQQAYNGTIAQIARKVYDEHIVARVKKVFPSYPTQQLIVEDNDTQSTTFVCPNIHPFPTIDMLAGLAVNEVPERATYVFYQTKEGFNFKTIQSMLLGGSRQSALRRRAVENKYIYNSNQMDDERSREQNDGRMVSQLTVNKRLSSFQKLSMGYYHNNLFEINIAQKAVWGTDTKVEDVAGLYPNKLNTEVYSQLAYIEGGEDDEANRVKFVVTTQKEQDPNYPISRARERWGKDLITTTAMAQVDVSIVIPGTAIFSAGDLFMLDIPEMHGFNNVERDDLISGLFVITQVKHSLMNGGFHSTTLRLNKDSYLSSVDRSSRYGAR